MSELNIGDFERLIVERDLAQEEFERLLREASQIADSMKELWKHQRSGAD